VLKLQSLHFFKKKEVVGVYILFLYVIHKCCIKFSVSKKIKGSIGKLYTLGRLFVTYLQSPYLSIFI